MRAVLFFSAALNANADEHTAVIAVEDDTTALSAVLLLITAAIAVEDDTTVLSADALLITAVSAVLLFATAAKAV